MNKGQGLMIPSLRADRFTWLALLFLAAIWSLPGVIALRNVLLLSLLVLLAWSVPKCSTKWGQLGKSVAIGLLVVTLWICLHTLFISLFPEVAWAELFGQWVKPLILFGVAYCIVLAWRGEGRLPVSALVAGLACLVIVAIGDFLLQWVIKGAPDFYNHRITGNNRTPLSYANNIMLAFVLADLVSAFCFTKRLLAWSRSVSVALLLLGSFGTYAFSARNGTLGYVFMLASSTVACTYYASRQFSPARKRMLVLGAAIFIGLGIWGSWKSDHRWRMLADSAVAAWNTEQNTQWIYGGDLPLMSDGNSVDQSAYMRLAWLKGGIQLAEKHPLGVGFGRNAFGKARKLEYGEAAGGGHSHSGWLDMALAIGIPGLLLWSGLMVFLMVAGIRLWIQTQSPAAIALFFIVSGFFGRSALDSNIRDHMLEMFLFMVGMLAAMVDRDVLAWRGFKAQAVDTQQTGAGA